MNKKEQIMQLVREWHNEDREHRTVILTMMTAENKTEEGEDLNFEGVLSGKEGHFIRFFNRVLSNESNPLHGILHKANILNVEKRILDYIDRTKGDDEEHDNGSENATEGGKSSENSTNE